MKDIEVQVGQIWLAGRPSATPRHVVVTKVDDSSVSFRNLEAKRRGSTPRKNMKPGSRGYSLVTDPSVLAELRARYRLTAPPATQENPGAAGQDAGNRAVNNRALIVENLKPLLQMLQKIATLSALTNQIVAEVIGALDGEQPK
jgi:hypothetical protein